MRKLQFQELDQNTKKCVIKDPFPEYVVHSNIYKCNVNMNKENVYIMHPRTVDMYQNPILAFPKGTHFATSFTKVTRFV